MGFGHKSVARCPEDVFRDKVLIDPALKADMASFQDTLAESVRAHEVTWRFCKVTMQDKSISMMDSG